MGSLAAPVLLGFPGSGCHGAVREGRNSRWWSKWVAVPYESSIEARSDEAAICSGATTVRVKERKVTRESMSLPWESMKMVSLGLLRGSSRATVKLPVVSGEGEMLKVAMEAAVWWTVGNGRRSTLPRRKAVVGVAPVAAPGEKPSKSRAGWIASGVIRGAGAEMRVRTPALKRPPGTGCRPGSVSSPSMTMFTGSVAPAVTAYCSNSAETVMPACETGGRRAKRRKNFGRNFGNVK